VPNKFEKLEEVEHPATHKPAVIMSRVRAIPISMSKPCGNARNTGRRQAMGGWLRILHLARPWGFPPGAKLVVRGDNRLSF
jgi:hypothetical protein